MSELQGSLFGDVAGYHSKYFLDAVLKCSQRSSVPYSTDASLAAVRQWLNVLGSGSQNGDLNRYVSVDQEKPLELGKALALVPPLSADTPPGVTDDAILVFGKLESHHETISQAKALHVFLERAIEIFAARPHRLFLHAFRLRDSVFETWTFDRAGAYRGREINIDHNPLLVRDILIEYTIMDGKRLGLDPALQVESSRTILRLGDAYQSTRDISFDETLVLARHEGLVGPGTSCFGAEASDEPRRPLVVKFAWSPLQNAGEWTLLERVKQKGIRGVVTLESYGYMGDISTLRKGLEFDQEFDFSADEDRPIVQSENLTSSGTSEGLSMGQPLTDVLIACKQTPAYENLKYECTVTSPRGRPLDTFGKLPALFKILGDAARALRSLFTDASIVHRDISTQNIMIAPPSDGDDETAAGLLIDLNLALDLLNLPEKQDLVGSEGFMAIGILGGDDATYRHDLESVFYVFLWLAICHDGTDSRKIPDHSRLHAWCGTDWLASFHKKKADMQESAFSAWTAQEFTEPFRPYLPLAKHLRDLLFPTKNGKMFIGTDFDDTAVQHLYEAMIAAFDEAARL